jgi:hypothetical protein
MEDGIGGELVELNSVNKKGPPEEFINGESEAAPETSGKHNPKAFRRARDYLIASGPPLVVNLQGLGVVL